MFHPASHEFDNNGYLDDDPDILRQGGGRNSIVYWVLKRLWRIDMDETCISAEESEATAKKFNSPGKALIVGHNAVPMKNQGPISP